jgi:ABC-type transport system involved in multi-copper enzyme maturation permease subunit
MSHVLAIARREIEERAFVFVAGIAIALVSLVVLFVPQGSFSDRKTAVVILGFFLGVAFTWSLALILGATLVGRELSEKRLSFYFARPVSGVAIWFGKLLAAIALLAVSFVIVHAIPFGAGGSEWQKMSTVPRGAAAGYVLAIAAFLLLGAHVLSTWIRSHSPLLAIDFVACVGAIGLGIASIAPLVAANASTPATVVVAILLAATLVAVVGGGARQLGRGRIDARRSHRELSAFVWIVVGVAATSTLVYSRWVVGATPRDLKRAASLQPGSMAEVHGAARGYWPEFVVNPATGAFVPGARLVASSGNVVGIVSLASTLTNTQRLFGRQPWTMDGVFTVSRLDKEPETIAVFPASGFIKAIGVSADGSRAAIVADFILTVYDTKDRAALVSSRVFIGEQPLLQFVSPNVIRTFDVLDTLRVRDLDLRTRKWSDVIAPVPAGHNFQYRVAGPVLMTRNLTTVEIRDLRRPDAVHTVPVGKENGVWLMADGRLAIYHYGQPPYVEIRRNGLQQRLIHFDHGAVAARVAGEIGRGKLLVSTHGPTRDEVSTYIVDADSGTISRSIPNASPSWSWPWGVGANDPEITHRVIVHRDTGKLDVIDLSTGAIRPLFQ